jgi:hypothetical protein
VLVLVAPEALPAGVAAGVRALAIVPEHGNPLATEALRAALGPLGRVEVVPGADPRFLSGLPAVGRHAVAFLDPAGPR